MSLRRLAGGRGGALSYILKPRPISQITSCCLLDQNVARSPAPCLLACCRVSTGGHPSKCFPLQELRGHGVSLLQRHAAGSIRYSREPGTCPARLDTC